MYHNKALQELNLAQQFDIHIVALYHHGPKIILTPPHHDKIRLYDELFILDGDEQIDTFSQLLRVDTYQEELKLYNHLELKTFLLDTSHPFVGLSIEEAMEKNHIDGIVLGMERKGVRKINPSKDTILRKENLLILLVDKSST